MDFTKSQFVSYILAYGGVVGVIWFLFEKAADTLKPKVKKDISKWLKNIDPVECSMSITLFDQRQLLFPKIP